MELEEAERQRLDAMVMGAIDVNNHPVTIVGVTRVARRSFTRR